MARRYNPNLQVLSFGSNDRWKKILPGDFVQGTDHSIVTYKIKTQYGGPWEVEAERFEGKGFYTFRGRGWMKFYDENFIRPGCRLLMARFEEFVVDALVFEFKGSPQRVDNPPKLINDWLVMLKRRPQGTGPNIAVWELELKPHHWFKFAIDKDFIVKAGLHLVDHVTLSLSGSSLALDVSVYEERYRRYFKEGMKDFLTWSGAKPGDRATFTCASADEGILVELRKLSLGIEVIFDSMA